MALEKRALHAEISGVNWIPRVWLAPIGILLMLGIFLAVGRGGGGESSVNEGKWVAGNQAVFASLRSYPTARFYLSKTWGVPDHIVHSASPSDNGPPYGGFVTEHRYELPKRIPVVNIVDFYTRQLAGWESQHFVSCEWSFTSPKGAAITVDACDANAPTTPEYVVDINYDQARTMAVAEAHGYLTRPSP